MIRRPKDAKQAKEFISKAHSDMKGAAMEKSDGSTYFQFWKGLETLMTTSFFKNLDNHYTKTMFSQVVVNVGCPVFERTIRDHSAFEALIEREKQNKKFSKRCGKFQTFVELVLSCSATCLKRQDVDETLRSVAQDCQDMFSDDRVKMCIYLVYISTKNMRRIVRLLTRRIEPTFCKNKRFGEADPMDAKEAKEVLSLL